MAAPQIARLPPFFVMSDGMRIVLTALDAASGNTVSGVNITNVTIDVDPGSSDATTDTPVPLNYEGIFFGT